MIAVVALLSIVVSSNHSAQAQLGFTLVPVSSNSRERRVIAAILIPNAVTPGRVRAINSGAVVAASAPSIVTNSRIKIVGESGGEYIFEVLHDPSGTALTVGGAIQYYSAPIAVIDASTDRAPSVKPLVGAFYLPFKWRPQTGKYEAGFSIGACGGVQIPINRANEDRTLSFLIGIGSSNVPVRVADVDAAFKLAETTNLGALTTCFTGLYAWKTLQFGLSVGIDHLFDNELAQWKYQDRAWISFGVGAKIFTPAD